MKLLNKTAILGADDVVFEDVSTPEWAPKFQADGVTPLTEAERNEFGVRIRNLTGSARGMFIQHSLELKAKEEKKEKTDFEIEILLVAMSAVDGDNQPLFTREDIAVLGAKNAAPIARLAEVASRLAGIDKASQDASAKK
jgi:hypothetical protein